MPSRKATARPGGPPPSLSDQLARERRITAALREVGTALGSTVELEALLELVLAKTSELLDSERAALFLLDTSGRELVSQVLVGHQVRAIRTRVGRGVEGHVASTGETIRVSNAYEDPRFEPHWDLMTGFKTTSMLAAPLRNHLGRITGVIQVMNKRSGAQFTAEDEALVDAFGHQAAIAIDLSRLFIAQAEKNRQLLDTAQQLQRKLADQSLLYELERATARAHSIQGLATAVLGRVAAACSAEGAALLLADEETHSLTHFAVRAHDSRPPERLPVRAGRGLLASVMRNGGTLNLRDASRYTDYDEAVDGSYPFPVRAVLVTALDGSDERVGAIGVFTRSGRNSGFTTEDAELLELVAANLSTAVRLYQASLARSRSERLTSIGRLLSQVIHDFKTPMTVISGYVQLMVDTEDHARRSGFADEILRQFDVLTAMQREVLAFAKGESTIFVRKVYVQRFFSELLSQVRHEFERRPVEFVLDIDGKTIARFDEARVGRAVHNLVRNALEAMGEAGGRLTVSAGIEGSDFVISVSDTGPGIPRDIEHRLFESFVSANKPGGTGLGLTIVKRVAEQHGGSVSVVSSPRGATFELRLPQVPLGQGSAPPVPQVTTSRQSAPLLAEVASKPKAPKPKATKPKAPKPKTTKPKTTKPKTTKPKTSRTAKRP
jgi:signal transduction histidine kinase/putative methionine-R-sulfoxide reductase with GAF domain